MPNVVIAEINYNGPDTPLEEDWAKVCNIGTAPVDIYGWHLRENNDNDCNFTPFTSGEIILNQGDCAVYYSDPYNDSTLYEYIGHDYVNVKIQCDGGFAGSTENIRLYDVDDNLVMEVQYDDGWYPNQTDGNGATLQLTEAGKNLALSGTTNLTEPNCEEGEGCTLWEPSGYDNCSSGLYCVTDGFINWSIFYNDASWTTSESIPTNLPRPHAHNIQWQFDNIITTCDDAQACNNGEEASCVYPDNTTNCCADDNQDIDGNGPDECGVCGGPGIPEGDCDCNGNQLDCNGDCGGTAVIDVCGVCGGDGSSCSINCTDILNEKTLRFSEIHPGGSEWFEIWNYGEEPVDLTNIRFVNTNDEDVKFANFELCSVTNPLKGSCQNCMLPAGEVLVVFEREMSGCGNDHPNMDNVDCYQTNWNDSTSYAYQWVNYLESSYEAEGYLNFISNEIKCLDESPCDDSDLSSGDCAHMDADQDTIGLYYGDPTGYVGTPVEEWVAGTGTVPNTVANIKWNKNAVPAINSCELDRLDWSDGIDKSDDRSIKLVDIDPDNDTGEFDGTDSQPESGAYSFAGEGFDYDRSPGISPYLELNQGCTDDTACNYDIIAVLDDGTCLYNDCNGECGGLAVIDDCGVCGGDGITPGTCDCEGTFASYPCWNGFLYCSSEECPPLCNACQEEIFNVGVPGWIINEWIDGNNVGNNNIVLDIIKQFLIDDTFINTLKEQYNILRAGDNIFDYNFINERFEYYLSLLEKTSQNNNNRWNIYGKTEEYKDILDEVKQWILDRIDYIDHNISRIKHQTNRDYGSICGNNPYTPFGLVGTSYCSDPGAENYLEESNYNDGTCIYTSDRKFVFEIDVSFVSWPEIIDVELEVYRINGEVVNYRYPMEQKAENIWKIELLRFDESIITLPGDVIEYHFIKYTPEIYTLETGAIEKDVLETFVVGDEFEHYMFRYFNNFVDVLEETNLPILKIDTTVISDSPETMNRWYCPGKLGLEGSAAGAVVKDWEDYEPECNALKRWIDDANGDEGYCMEVPNSYGNFEEDCGTDNNEPCCSDTDFRKFGYFSTQELCEINTNCEIDCINGTNIMDEPKIAAQMDIIYNGENVLHTIEDVPQITHRIGIEVRGFSHRGFAKKQYLIELQNENNVFPQCDDDAMDHEVFCNGFTPEPSTEYDGQCSFKLENDFVLLGPIRDRTYMKNVISYEIWQKLQEDYEYPHDIQTKYVELMINDVYMGLYVFMERVQEGKHRIPIAHGTETSKILNCTGETFDTCNGGGFIIKVESGGEQEHLVLTDGRSKIEYYEPDSGDVNQTTIDFISNQILILENSIPHPEVSNIENKISTNPNHVMYDPLKKIDINSFVDYLLVQELARNNEGYTRSQYWYTYGEYQNDPNQIECIEDECVDYKFYMGPVWDFNHAYGGILKEYRGWSIAEFFAVSEMWYKLIYNYNFKERIVTRYNQLRDTTFSIDNIINRIDEIYSIFKQNGAILRDNKRWFVSTTQDFYRDVSEFKQWIVKRLLWMDDNVCYYEELEDYDKFPYFLTCGLPITHSGDRYNLIPYLPPASAELSGEILPGLKKCTQFLSSGQPFYGMNFDFPFSCPFDMESRRTSIIITDPYQNQTFSTQEDKYIDFNFAYSEDVYFHINNPTQDLRGTCTFDLTIPEWSSPTDSDINIEETNITLSVDDILFSNCTWKQNWYGPNSHTVVVQALVNHCTYNEISFDGDGFSSNDIFYEDCYEEIENIAGPFINSAEYYSNWSFEGEEGKVYDSAVVFNIQESISSNTIFSFTSRDAEINENVERYRWYYKDFGVTGNFKITGTIGYRDVETGTENILSISEPKYFNIFDIKPNFGCTDVQAVNFDIFALIDDGTCKYKTDCDVKYLEDVLIRETINNILVYEGFNIISYPYDLAEIPGMDFFTVLNNSYTAINDQFSGGFQDYDFITTYFEGKLYSATFINGVWVSDSSKGLLLDEVSPGMGFILNIQKDGEIKWRI